MTWIRRASMTAALAALLASGACAAKQEPAQPAAGSEAPAASGQPLAPTSSQPADEAESEAAGTPAAGTPAVGSAAVAATVRDAGGEPVALASAWQTGPAVLVFYRGHW